jgi:hypothetical protein
MGKKRSRVVFDEWDTYVTEIDEEPLFISFDVQAARQDMTDTLEHCARVLLPIQQPNANGGPVQPESDRLWEMEDALCGTLSRDGVDCRLVGRLTHAGVRELVFQLSDWDSFRPPVGAWIGENRDYQIDVPEHAGWQFFDDCIRPTPETWLFLEDQHVVETLIKSGSNPDKEHTLEYLFMGEPAGLKAIIPALEARGYQHLRALDSNSDQIVMVKPMMLDVNAIFQESRANAQLAEEHGVTCDGWETAVVT